MAVDVVALWSCTLREPTLSVQVGGETFHLHRTVLQKSEFLSPTLDKDWVGDEPLNLDLPCTAEEFVLLLVALYTGEEIGTPRLPVPDLACALRLARAADKLLVAEHVPELKRVLQSAVRTPEDRVEAAATAPTLAPALREALESVCGTSSDDLDAYGLDVNEKVCSGIMEASNEQGQQVIWSVLTALWGHLNAQDVAKAANQLMRGGRRSSSECAFAARIAAEKLDVRHAMLVIPNQPSCFTASFLETFEVVHRAHVLRCARERTLAEIIERRLVEDTYMEYFFYRPLLFTEAFLASPPDQLDSIMQAMHRMKVGDMQRLLSAELLRAVPSHAEALVQPLLQDSENLRSWATKEILAALPLRLKQAACIALLPQSSRVKPEVAEVVMQVLAGVS